MDNAIYQSWTKGTTSEVGAPRYSASWVSARRGWFKIFSDRVQCGDWVIPSSSVKDAVLFEARQWFLPVYILSITTSEKTWQFGFNPWSRVGSHLPFPARHEKIKLRYSWFSIVTRLVVLAYVVHWVWGKWNA